MKKAMFLEAQISGIETHGFGSKAKARITIDLYTTDDKNMAILKNLYADDQRVTVIMAEGIDKEKMRKELGIEVKR